MYLMGIDVGTSGCKAAIFSTSGRLLRSAGRTYPLLFPREGWMELDPDEVYNAVIRCISECCMDGLGDEVSAIAISSQGEAIIPVGHDGRPVYNAIVTFDSRNTAECNWFGSQFDKSEIMNLTGAPIHPMFSLTKIVWLKNNLPERYSQIWMLMCFGDYIAYRLGADPCIDYSMASRTMAFDIHHKQWSDRILDACGISKRLLPSSVLSGTRIGSVSKDIAKLTGLQPDTAIVAGAHDQVCCALGAGVVKSGIAVDSLGTTESILSISDKAVITPQMAEFNLPCYAYAMEGYYAYLTFLSCSASILKWFKEGLLHDDTSYKDYDTACKTIKRPGGIFALPYFAGSGTPYLDTQSKGIFAGLTLGTDRYQLYLSIMEGTAFEARMNIENMEECGIPLHELRCIGGGSISDIWLQLKADITGREITSMEVSEAGCLGAAALAGFGIGAFDNVADAVSEWVRIKNIYKPDMETHELYNIKYKKYALLYEMSKQIFY